MISQLDLGFCRAMSTRRLCGRNGFIRLALRLALVSLFFCLPARSLADGDAPPTLAFLRFGQSPSFALTDMAVLDMLEVYGYISAEERATLEAGNDLRGEKLNLLYRDAGFDFSTANLMVEDALDEGADVLLTVSTEVGAIALGAMGDMQDPPALIFAIVTDPHDTGLAAATCIKPANVTGTLMYIDYRQFSRIAYLQDPDFASIGYIGDANDPAAPGNVETVKHISRRLGFQVEVELVVSAADYAIAAESLLDKGVDAIGLLPHTGSESGIAALVEAAYGVPVFSPLVSDVIHGVTIAAGFEGWYREGIQAARMVIAYLEGNLDIASTAIASTPSFAVAVNLDSAAAQGLEIADALLAEADFILQGGKGESAMLEVPGEIALAEMTLAERRAEDAAFLANLHCSPDMIAEQQVAAAAGGA